MKRFILSACHVAVISLLLSVIWPSHSNAAMPTIASLGQLRAEKLDVPGAMAVDGAGNLFVADARGGEVFKFDRYGRMRAVIEAQATGRGLAVSVDGSKLYVAGIHGVAVVSADNGERLADLGGTGFKLVGGIELDGAGNVYVADNGVSEQTISVFSSTGEALAKFGGAGDVSGKFRQIGGMAFNSVGQLVVVDQSAVNNKVQVFNIDPVSYAATVVGTYLTTSSANFGVPGIVAPRGIAFDSQGRGYFVDFLNSQVRVVSSAMAYQGSYGQAGFGPGQLAYIDDVVIAASVDSVTGKVSERLFISGDSGRIEIFGIDGGVSPVFVNHAPSMPVLQSPVAGSEVAVAAPTLQFAAATDQDGDAVTYQVTVQQGVEVVSRVSTPSTAIALPSGLLVENAAYTWTVEAFDSEGAGSGAGTPAGFVINAVNEPPVAPTLVAPLKGETLAGDGVLAWQSSTDPDPNDTLLGYQIEVAADAAFASPVLSARVSGTEIALADFAAYAELIDGGAYFWRAAAIDSDDLVSVSGTVGTFVYDTALLKVTANMPGASVYLGGNHGFAGRYVGTVPVELRDMAPGAFSVVVERSGFEPYVAQITVAGADNAAVYAAMTPAKQPAAFQLVGNVVNGRTGLDVGDAAAPFLVDFDNDGGIDLLTGSANGSVTLFSTLKVTKGQLSFQAGKSLGLPVMPGAVPFVADWDNDGRKDLLVGLTDGSVKLFLNVGQESAPAFGAGQDLTVAGSVLNVGGKAAPVVVDLDGDGAKDLVIGNAAGQVLAFFNKGTDAAPQLVAPVLLAQLSAAAIPASVDWDADGQRDLLVIVNSQPTLLRNDLTATGTFVAGAPLPVDGANAAFSLNIDGIRGKDLLVGQADGKLTYWAGNSSTPTAAALSGLLAKVDEVADLVAEVAPSLLGDVNKIRGQIEAASLGGAAKTADVLVTVLPAGTARVAVTELSSMCKAK